MYYFGVSFSTDAASENEGLDSIRRLAKNKHRSSRKCTSRDARLLIRYQTTDRGRKKLAKVYTIQEHGIARNNIAPEALSVLRRLSRAGHEAYIVGGAVRDMLVGKEPKDYDIATDARPTTVRRLFRRSRVIGRRFRLVHVYVQDQIIEVSTFRTNPKSEIGTREANNSFGTLADDVRRRDFSFNALYYDADSEKILDYVDGFDDIKASRLKLLKPADVSFEEDPVRMIRALRYAATTGFKVPVRISRIVRRMAVLLKDCPVSRLTEELFKILGCGASARFFSYAEEFDLLAFLLPVVSAGLNERRPAFYSALEKLDSTEESVDRALMIRTLCEPFLDFEKVAKSEPELYQRDLFRRCKKIVAPLTPPNADVERAVAEIMRSHGVRQPKRRRRRTHR